MFVFNQDTLIRVLESRKNEGVDLVSYGRPRDGFRLPVDVPNFTSGFGGKYEMRHSNVPMGTMIAVGNLEDLDISDHAKLKEQLKELDIYPTGHSGDFTGQNVNALNQWFMSRSRVDNEVNSQTPIAHAKELTPEGLGQACYDDLVNYLADNMNLFKNPEAQNYLVPDDRDQRKRIVAAMLGGLSQTVRYTRLDDPAKAFQITGQVRVEKGSDGAIILNLSEESKILVLREYKNGSKDLTPLDRSMLGRTYVTKDGDPLGMRGAIDLSVIALEAQKMENESQPNLPKWLRFSASDTLRM